ncbi:MAG: hypothetical protein ACXW5U_09310 [Thermoanaerobaculia bacterium]
MKLSRYLAATLLFVAMPALGRELHWDALEVKAHLDAEGRLRVDETQVMVLTGDWNGGERTFDVRPRQSIELHGMGRVDESGQEVALREGSLEEVDRYAWAGRNKLRWRSRAPSDPEFDQTRITYVLHYTLSNVLQADGDRYRIDHDFAFPERNGEIRRIAVDLTLDPVWQTTALQTSWLGGPLAPGKVFVVKVPLRYTGSGSLEGLGMPREVRWMLGALLLLPATMLALAFIRETLLGRLAPVRVEDVSRSWLQQNVLPVRSEVIGAMWDQNVGPPEVAALLARLTAEGKITSKVRQGVMHMTLEVPRDDFEGYERKLIDGLFFRDSTTSTAQIRNHYESTGFNPSQLIAEDLLTKVEESLPKGKQITLWKWPLTLLWLVSVALLVYAVIRHPHLLMTAVFTFFGGLFVSVFVLIGPEFWRRRVDFGIGRALLLLMPAAAVVAAVAWSVLRAYTLGLEDWPLEMQIAITVLALWMFGTAVWTMRTRSGSREAIAMRKMLTAARAYFRRELRKPRPALDDAWYPYVIAFGLDRDVQRWYREVSSARRERSSSSSSWSSSASSSFSSSSWTGGGGAFGGAGATATWAAAAATMAAGVASPSSSSSGGGSSSSSSSGGGSSGGGGGGGW